MRRRRNGDKDVEDNGFAAWVIESLSKNPHFKLLSFQGGYMEAKKAKLVDQFNTATLNQVEKKSNIFAGVKIFVNGRTTPTSEELKVLMATHGGEYHTYQSSKTTHIIASNLPNVKVISLYTIPIYDISYLKFNNF